MRALIVVGILCLLNGYIALRVSARWPWAQQHVSLFWGIALAFLSLQLIGPVGDRVFFPPLKQKADLSFLFSAIDWVSYISLGVMSCLFIYSLFLDIFSLIWISVKMPANTVDFDRRALLALGVATVGTAALGIGQAQAGPVIREVEIPLKNLPDAFDGFKIVQISDLHVSGMIGHEYTKNVVAMANGLKPDLIALTGDFVDGSVQDLAPAIEPLVDLKAHHGKFYITGNHEYYWGAEEWVAHFKTLGARVLLNEHEVIDRGGSKIVLAGVTDYSTLHLPTEKACSPQKAIQGAPADLTKILLAHQPATFRLASDAGFDLQLSGHTHAGQYFPFSLFIGFFQRYYKGLNRHENMWIYVNSGTGFWGPPLRTANPSEITSIVLRKATA